MRLFITGFASLLIVLLVCDFEEMSCAPSIRQTAHVETKFRPFEKADLHAPLSQSEAGHTGLPPDD